MSTGCLGGTSAQDYHSLYCKELLVCLLAAESVKALCGKQITPYLLNKAFLISEIRELKFKKSS